jgi:hypothetical protein
MQSRWRLPFTWLGLLALAVVIIELTHQPALGAIAVCLKFGWEDFLAARWLWRSDPELWRRRSTFWLYLAWGLWKTAAVAFLMSFGFALLARGKAPAAAPPGLFEFLGTFLTTLVGFTLSGFMTGFAVLFAWFGGVRLWLDRAVHSARRRNCWPPSLLCEGRTNRLGHLLLTALALGFVAVLIISIAVAPLIPRNFLAIFLSVVLLPAPVFILVFRDLISRKIHADSPYECWQTWDEDANEPWQEDPVT